MNFINSIRHFFERHGFDVSSRFADRLGMRATNVRLFFIYISFVTVGLWFGLYLTMAFLQKDDRRLGTTDRKLDHWLGFTRLSLFHFGPLAKNINLSAEKSRVLSAFKHVYVLWFCIMLSMLIEEPITTDMIEYVVKFLSYLIEPWGALPRIS